MRIKELRANAREDAQGSKMKLALPVFLLSLVIYLLGIIPRFLPNATFSAIIGLVILFATLAPL